MHVRKGDTVEVIAGKEKGKRGKVMRLLTEKNRVVVERINMVKRHTRPTQRNPQGGIIEKEGSLAVSNVLPYCPKCGKGVRIKHAVTDGKKSRVCAKCGGGIETAA
jgi:large subunit ribosomal protein L24